VDILKNIISSEKVIKMYLTVNRCQISAYTQKPQLLIYLYLLFNPTHAPF